MLDSFKHSDLFHSARLKLTAYYFAIIAILCLLLTFGVRAITSYELQRNDDARLGTVQQLFKRYTDLGDNYGLGSPGGRYFVNAQQQEADATRDRLNHDFVLMDIGLLLLGAGLSYWYAGRTLKPIAEAHEQQKRFTSDASHELRTPLTAMRLENEVFLRQKSFGEKAARAQIASNLEEVERLEKLAANLLALSRYEAGTQPHEPVVISEVINEAVARIRRDKHAAKVEFVEDVTPARVDVNADSITELFTILFDNAIKYGPKDGKVEITGRLAGEQYVVTVRDHGPGISDEDLPHVFERMYRGDKARSSKVGGHGIGLSLARQIASANEATLEAGNAPGGGAVFTLTLQ